MKMTNKLKLELEDQSKCEVYCDPAATLGELYDFACKFSIFIAKKINENAPKEQEEIKE